MHYLTLTVDGKTIAPPTGIPTGGINKLVQILQFGVAFLLVFATIIALLYLIWGGTIWIMSGGDKAKIESARQQITYALIGVAVSFAAFMIVNFFAFFFHANLFLK